MRDDRALWQKPMVSEAGKPSSSVVHLIEAARWQHQDQRTGRGRRVDILLSVQMSFLSQILQETRDF